MQLVAPPPYDLDRIDLAEYKGVWPLFDCWVHVAELCGQLSDCLLKACMRAAHTAERSRQAARAGCYLAGTGEQVCPQHFDYAPCDEARRLKTCLSRFRSV
ncbi:MAG TPA: hypothetical protein VJ770_08380 [Stellaceae bacterium]|nr:hypothetical protein [Stellaceae bacterium]